MKLQIAFDVTHLETALEIAHAVEPYADIFEVGTLLLYQYGIEAVEQFVQHFPHKSLLVDTKIVDHGKETVALFNQLPIDWLTIMAGTSKDTIHAVNAQRANKVKVMLDILDSNSAGQSAMEAKQMGIDALLVHRSFEGKDQPGFLEHWEMIIGNTDLPVFLVGRINKTNIHDIVMLKPDGIVIGSAIVKAEDPAAMAVFFADQVK